jgi:hypothetical protein
MEERHGRFVGGNENGQWGRILALGHQRWQLFITIEYVDSVAFNELPSLMAMLKFFVIVFIFCCCPSRCLSVFVLD